MNTRLQQTFREHGVRLTAARRTVLQVLSDATEHLEIAEVHRRARRLNPGIGLASVYRTIELLARLRLVKHVHVDHRHQHFALTTAAHCHHLICRSCGTVVEFSDCQIGGLVRSLARRTRFRIESHTMDLFGLCPDCRHHPARPTGARCVTPSQIAHPAGRRERRHR